MLDANHIKRNTGLTLIETIVVLAILGILIAIGIPLFINFQQKKEVINAIHHVQQSLHQARSYSTNKQTAIALSLDSLTEYDAANEYNFSSFSKKWCIGINTTSACECSSANSCMFDGNEYTISEKDFQDIRLYAYQEPIDNSSGSALAQSFKPDIILDAARNLTEKPTWVVIYHSSGNYSATLKVNNFGLVEICSNTLNDYPNC